MDPLHCQCCCAVSTCQWILICDVRGCYLRATQWLNPFIPLHAALSFETTCVPSWFGSAQQSPEPAKARPADLGSEPAKARSASPAQKPSPGKEAASASLQYRLWLRKRADLFGFLAPLSGKRLVCNCGDQQSCHGNVLIELWEDMCQETDENTGIHTV